MNILSFFAHPDDETILAGGLLALLARLGYDVHYVVCTRGEGGEVGDPPVGEQAQLGEIRALETANAVAALGGKSLTFLDYIDPRVGADNVLFTFTDDLERLTAQLAAVVESLSIDVILSHGSNGEYGHPAHKTVYQAAERLFRRQPSRVSAWYSAQASYEGALKEHLINPNDPANWVLDAASVLPEKIRAAKAHISQNALFVRRKQTELKRPVTVEEVIVGEESYHLAGGEKDLLLAALQPLGVIRIPDLKPSETT